MDIKSRYQNYIITGLILTFGFLIGFGFDRLINLNQATQIIIDKNVKIGLPVQTGLPVTGERVINKPSNPTSTNYVASINGSAYYPVNCKAAEKIKEENRVWFNSAQEAELDGYAPAKNCP